MKNISIILVILFLGFSTRISSQSTNSIGILTVEVTGFQSNVGQAILQLYGIYDNVPSKPSKIITAQIVNKKAVFKINNLLYGNYAIIVVHDQNSNGKIDHSFGFLAEPLVFSNAWKLSIFSGMPNFEKLKFSFDNKTEKVNIVFSD